MRTLLWVFFFVWLSLTQPEAERDPSQIIPIILSHTATTHSMLSSLTRRTMSSAAASKHCKVAVLGAGGGIGQPLSMLLKLSNYVDELACYDIVGTPGVAADLSHVSGEC